MAQRYRVSANPKGGTCFQIVTADSPEEAIQKAQDAANNWLTAKPKSSKDWTFKAYERS